MEDVAALKEENEKLRKEVEALLQAKEIAKEKVRSAIQELVDENKRLKKKVTTLEAQVASLLAERVNLVQRLGETGNSTGGLAGSQENGPRARSFTEADVSQEKGLHKSMSANLSSALEHNSTPVERSYSSDDLNGRAKKGGPTSEVSDLTGSMRTGSRRPSSSKAASFFGLTETKIIDEMKNVPEALTIEEPGLLMMRLENELLEIKGGFLAKLVERLYHPTTAQQAPMYANSFFLTYRAFASTVDVANLLFEAYEARVKDDSSQSKEQRERILRIFGQWLEIQPEDFLTLGERWDRFLTDSVVKADGRGWVKELQKVARLPSRVSAPILEETSTPKNGGAASSPRSVKKEKLPKSIVPRSKGFSLDDLDPVEMARQLTLIDYELFQRIRPCELNNLAWNRKEKETEAPNLLKMIHRFNEVSIWVQYVIVSADNLKKRATYVEKFVKIGQQFLKHKNYNGIMQIVSAMEGAAIHRLNKTFEKVKPGTKKKYQHLHELMSASSSYKSYRESIQDKEPPCIPYVGVHLTDLTAMYETHKNTLAPKYPDYLNFSKHQNVANLMRMIIKYQSNTYQLYTVPVIKEWIIGQLDKFGPTPEEKLFEMSLAAEPRED